MPASDPQLRMLSLRLSPGSPFLTYLAIKPHRVKPGELDPGPSLFLSGLPFSFGEEAVEAVFSCFGDVQQVVLHGTKVSVYRLAGQQRHLRACAQLPHWQSVNHLTLLACVQRSGMVVFEEQDSLAAAMASAESKSIVEWSLPEDTEGPVGVKGETRN